MPSADLVGGGLGCLWTGEVLEDIKTYLDEKLISLIMQNIDIVLDYSFWSREMRNEYISLLKKYDIEPKIYYIKTPKEVVMERIRKRNGNHQNDIILTEQTASTYYDHFQPPTAEEGEVIVVSGNNINAEGIDREQE